MKENEKARILMIAVVNVMMKYNISVEAYEAIYYTCYDTVCNALTEVTK